MDKKKTKELKMKREITKARNIKRNNVAKPKHIKEVKQPTCTKY